MDWYGCEGNTYAVREGGGRVWDCAVGPEVGGRCLSFLFYISW